MYFLLDYQIYFSTLNTSIIGKSKIIWGYNIYYLSTVLDYEKIFA